MYILIRGVLMKNIDALISVWQNCKRTVMITDSKMNVLWCNKQDEKTLFDASKLHYFGERGSSQVIDSPVTAQYDGGFGLSRAVEILPIENGSDGYVLEFYDCDDIELLSDRSAHLRYKSNFLGNIRSELSQLIFMLDANRQKYVEHGDLDYLRFDKEARYRILRTFSATVNMNELAKYYNGYYTNDTVCVSQVLTELAQELTEIFDKHSCKFSCDIKPRICLYTNADRLRAAVCNLLINAYMYNESEERTCKLTVTSQDDMLTISVEDNGGRVSVQELESCKKPFSSFRSFSEQESLGIAIAAKYCESLGGELSAKVCDGISTAMIMKIPINTDRTPKDFRIDTAAPITSRYDLQYCILAKGVDPDK